MRYVGPNTDAWTSCDVESPVADTSPCHFLERTAEATGSFDDRGRPLVYDLPARTPREAYARAVAEGIEATARDTLASDARVRVVADPSSSDGVDATTAFVENAELMGFEGAWPGLRARLRVHLRNTSVRRSRVGAFWLRLELRTQGGVLLGATDLIALVPPIPR